jgi:Ni/Co efflux regulator RcnB
MNTNRYLQRTLAILAASCIAAAAPAFAKNDGDHPGKGGGKGAQKQAEKAEKHAAKADKHAAKEREKAAKWNHKAGKHKDSDDVRVGAFFNDDHRNRARTYYTTTYAGGKACPPGLAKKNNGCMPPGQAKKFAVGQPLPAGTVYYGVPQPVLVQLPPVPVGYRYVRIGNDIVLLSPQTGLVVDIINGLLG